MQAFNLYDDTRYREGMREFWEERRIDSIQLGMVMVKDGMRGLRRSCEKGRSKTVVVIMSD